MWKRLTIVALLVIVLFLVRNRRLSGATEMFPAIYDMKNNKYSCFGTGEYNLVGTMCVAVPKQFVGKSFQDVVSARPARQGMGCPLGKKKSARGSFCIDANSTDDRTNTIMSGTGMTATFSCPPGTYPEQAGPPRATTKCWPNETPLQSVATCPDKKYPKLIGNKCYSK